MSAASEFHDYAEMDGLRRQGINAFVFRVVSFIFGAALIVAGLGLWLVPGSDWSPELLLIKVALTGLFVLGGYSFLQAGKSRRDRG